MHRLILLLFVLPLTQPLAAQAVGALTDIHPLEPPRAHYARLRELSPSPVAGSSLDTLLYPPEEYRNNTLLFALAAPKYLTSGQVDFFVNQLRYPANSSQQTRAELDYLLDVQQNRTAAEVERTMLLGKVGYWPDANHVPSHPKYKKNRAQLLFECREVVGSNCTVERYPATTELLAGVMNDMRLMEFAVKYRLLRARPYQLEERLQPLKRIGSPSFVSGHTLWAYLQAYVFGELLPERRSEFVELAYEIGLSREIMGVHYPSDEEMARRVAHRMLQLMWHDRSFQQDFAAARSEWNK